MLSSPSGTTSYFRLRVSISSARVGPSKSRYELVHDPALHAYKLVLGTLTGESQVLPADLRASQARKRER